MDNNSRAIFRAIHEGKWLKIEYKNQSGTMTRYWGAVSGMNPINGSLTVDGLHLRDLTICSLHLLFNSIQTAELLEGTYCKINQALIRDIEQNPEEYERYFGNVSNVRILNYLELCNRMDSTPYVTDYDLVKYLDNSKLTEKIYPLSADQFEQIVKHFQNKNSRKNDSGMLRIRELGMNVLSINTPKGLYLLAYRQLNFDVKNHCLRPAEDITICREFLMDGGSKESIRRFLDAEDYELLADFEKNQEVIKDCIMQRDSRNEVDDVPYIIGLGRDVVLDLHSEYSAIEKMVADGTLTVPLEAFFGKLLDRPRRNKAYPIALINNKINLDQILAINNAMKYPTAYIQGPPGTGKTNTIINTIVTAFFNEKTVLFASYNNHPLDGVFAKLTGLSYNGRLIPFPALRVGNVEKVKESIQYIRNLREQVKRISVFEETLDRRKGERKERAKKLAERLKAYEELLDLKEREETLERMLEFQNKAVNALEMMPFTTDLGGRQLSGVRSEIAKRADFSEKEALSLLDDNAEEFLQYLYFTSAKHIQRLEGDKFRDFREILNEPDEKKQLDDFNKYLQKSENVKKLQQVFPIIITTCLSAHRLGKPEPLFDMTIMDEASQCNVAVSLVPILRGENLMLVGDPQQLNPVILLDSATNECLKKQYQVSEFYDYRAQSIYKVFLACDSVTDEVLLHNHYRCDPKIIGFNNKKYYNSKLNVKTVEAEKPLLFVNVQSETPKIKNTSPEEAEKIVAFAAHNKDKTIGIITPFVNQKALIERKLEDAGLFNVACGTIHSFQGDEKDVILFSTAISEGTREGTYNWLRNNKELINVATSRARERLIILGSEQGIERLHNEQEDDLYELVKYVKENGAAVVTPKQANSRALGVKPFSTETEEAFLMSLNHALGNLWLSENRFTIKKEVAISQVFIDDLNCDKLFYTGRFDFVVYERRDGAEYPILAIELDGKEHHTDETVKQRDRRKEAICQRHNLQLIRVENVYARRYAYIKNILIDYFKTRH